MKRYMALVIGLVFLFVTSAIAGEAPKAADTKAPAAKAEPAKDVKKDDVKKDEPKKEMETETVTEHTTELDPRQ